MGVQTQNRENNPMQSRKAGENKPGIAAAPKLIPL